MRRAASNQAKGRNPRQKSKGKNKDPNLILRPAFRGQPVYQCMITSNFTKSTTTVTTGAIATVITISTANITNFATRFQGFEEYRIVKAVLKINCFSSTNPGRIIVYIDDDDNTTPTLTTARSHRFLAFAASSVDKVHSLMYVPHDPEDLAYTSVGTALSIGYFKIYTDNAALGSSTVATDYLDYHIEYTFQFRGFQDSN